MNIFTVSNNPVECAEVLDNKRLVKMVLETAQILSSAHLHLFGTNLQYRPTHLNHPVVKWAGQSVGNFNWTVELFKALGAEYTKRYNKIHKSIQVILPLIPTLQTEYTPVVPSDFCNCTNYKELDTFTAYRKCLADKWENDKQVQIVIK